MSFNENVENPQEGRIILNPRGDVKDVNTGQIVESRTPVHLDLPGTVQGLHEPTITINSQGDVKDVFSGEVTKATEFPPNLDLPQTAEPSNPTPSQNEMTLEDIKRDFRYRTKKVKTDSVTDPSGARFYRQDAHQDLESGTWEAREGAQPAPETASLIVAREKQPPKPKKENDFSRSDKAEIKKDLAGDNFKDSLSELMSDEDARKYNKSFEIKENAKRNEGFNPKANLSHTGKDFFARQDQITEDARRDVEIPVRKPFDVTESFEKTGAQFEPSVVVARGSNGSERLMIRFSRDGFTRVGFDELNEAIATKRVTPDGKVIITYQGGRRDNNGKPTYSQDIILTPEQATSLESLVDTVNKDKDTIVKDLKRETFSSSLDELMTTDDAKRYENAFNHLEDIAKADALKAENEGLTPEQKTIMDLRRELDRLYEILRERGITIPPVVTPEPIVPPIVTPEPIEPPIVTPEPIVPPVVTPEPIVPPVVTPEPIEPPIVTPEPIVPPIVTPEPIVPPIVTPEPVEPPAPTPPLPGPVSADVNAQLTELQNQLRELRGENTPEQKSAALGRGLAELETKLATEEGLTDAEKIRYFDLSRQKLEIDRGINLAEQENAQRVKRKERIIKIVAGAAGIGVALATPAIGVAAVIGVVLGGRFIGKRLKASGEKLRSQSHQMKFESRMGKSIAELAEMDKKQKRREWWANRLGEASAVLIGGATGYGIGAAFEGLVGHDFYIGSNATTPTAGGPDVGGPDAGGPDAGGPDAGGPDVGGPDAGGPDVSGSPDLGGPENWMTEKTFSAADLGWDYNRLGWIGDNVHLTNLGGPHGVMQGEFFGELTKLVPREELLGQVNGDIVNQFLGQAYRGANPIDAARAAAEILLKQ